MRGRISALVWAATAVALTLSLVLFPETALESAKEGMHLFLNVVFPSLLPFFILSEIMLGLGVVHFIGVLFEPLMRPLFNVPEKALSFSVWVWQSATRWMPSLPHGSGARTCVPGSRGSACSLSQTQLIRCYLG